LYSPANLSEWHCEIRKRDGLPLPEYFLSWNS
jgi:hypothetical protein